MNCKQCDSDLSSKREGAKYCSHNCRQKYFNRKKKIRDQIDWLERSGRVDQVIRDQKVAKLTKRKEVILSRMLELKAAKSDSESEFAWLESRVNMTLETYAEDFESVVRNNPSKFPTSYNIILHAPDAQYWAHIRAKQDELVVRYNGFKTYNERYESNLARMESDLLVLDKLIISAQEVSQSELEEAERREEEIKELKLIDLEYLPPQPKPIISKDGKRQVVNKPKPMSPSEILNKTFDGVRFPGDLGKFLGKLQREKCAIALTGDSGAGKSYFSFELANAFDKNGLSVAYFSLESGITEKIQDLILKYQFSDQRFKVFGEGKLEDVKRQANSYDCVIVDSYSKIAQRAEEFENLRHEFPNTFFILIFQKTTDGKIRGGSSIVYNCTAAIDIRITPGNHRIAMMTKSRFETQNFIYSINSSQILKEDQTPITWKQVCEKWNRSMI